MPLHRRLPKRGFHNKFRIDYHVINVEDLARLGESTEVTPETLRQAGVIGSPRDWRVKILGNGEVPRGLKVKVHKISRPAREKIERAGGTIELVK
jgi:large subunit ribosomal protein L15